MPAKSLMKCEKTTRKEQSHNQCLVSTQAISSYQQNQRREAVNLRCTIIIQYFTLRTSQLFISKTKDLLEMKKIHSLQNFRKSRQRTCFSKQTNSDAVGVTSHYCQRKCHLNQNQRMISEAKRTVVKDKQALAMTCRLI